MFTGIVEELGEVVAVEDLGQASRLHVRGPLVTSDAAVGDSIAVNGVCLTVVTSDNGGTALAPVPLRFTAQMQRVGGTWKLSGLVPS